MFWAASSRSKIDCTGTSISKNWQLRTVLEPSSHWHKLTLNQEIITKRSEQITFWMCTLVEKRQEHRHRFIHRNTPPNDKEHFFPWRRFILSTLTFQFKVGGWGPHRHRIPYNQNREDSLKASIHHSQAAVRELTEETPFPQKKKTELFFKINSTW